MNRDLRVCHVITSLAGGGAQAMLLRLLERSPRLGISASVVSLAGPSVLSRPCADTGARLVHLPADPSAALRAIAGSDVVQTWLPHADLFGGLVARAAGRPVAWNLRNSNPGAYRVKRHTRMAIAACARLSGSLPEAIVCCGDTARDAYIKAGYCPHAMETIPNGFDLDVLKPDRDAPAWLRSMLGLDVRTPVVAMVARWDPQKDHRTFLSACALAIRQVPGLHAIACGEGVDEGNPTLASWRRETGLEGRVHLLGHRHDARRIMAGCDATMLSSMLEGFPNVVAESMALGTPCISTRAGDAASIVDGTAPIAEIGDTAGLAAALASVLTESDERRLQRAAACRQHIAARFSLDAVSRRYAELWLRLARGRGASCLL